MLGLLARHKTLELIDDDREGTLFVDEVYRLVPPGSTRDFGIEAMDTLMSSIEGGSQTETDRPAMILAGYREAMETVISCNRGLARRMTDRQSTNGARVVKDHTNYGT